MTVRDLIALLEKVPPNLTVIVDLHSEMAVAGTVEVIEALDMGGYIAEPYDERSKLRAHEYVYITIG